MTWHILVMAQTDDLFSVSAGWTIGQRRLYGALLNKLRLDIVWLQCKGELRSSRRYTSRIGAARITGFVLKNTDTIAICVTAVTLGDGDGWRPGGGQRKPDLSQVESISEARLHQHGRMWRLAHISGEEFAAPGPVNRTVIGVPRVPRRPRASAEQETVDDEMIRRPPHLAERWLRRWLAPAIEVPQEYVKTWSREQALVEIVRGRLEGLGPTTAVNLAESIAVPVGDVDIALLALEAEGFVMRGSFTPTGGTEWCERRLLARITRYTVKRLRQEIEPVSAADYMQFLFDWQHVGERMEGPDAVAAVVSQLEGFEAAAGSWETELIPARVSGYEPHWLDDLCRAGRVVWTRLQAPRVDASRVQGAALPQSLPASYHRQSR